MSKITIEGGHTLSGVVNIGGAKNSTVALIPASILSNGKSVIYNVPQISDIEYLIKILELLNCKCEKKDDALYIDSTNIKNAEIPYELTSKLRASYYFMGSLLAKFKRVTIYFPGGCKIGARPIDLHLMGFEALGAKIEYFEEEKKYIITSEELTGNNIYLDVASVGATINIMLAAVGAKGVTVIENAAREPEIVNVASFLINMGAKITGAGTNKIVIEGNRKLGKGVVEVFPDRIEAGTYIIIGALIGDNLVIKGAIKEHINAFLIKLEECGIDYKYDKYEDTITISKCENFKPANIKTLVYPGFPTDLQQPITTLLTQAKGKSKIEETIYENRFQNSEYLNEMGANTGIVNGNLIIKGPTKLVGTSVTASDLRAGACLLIAGLIAEGITTIDHAEHILRGYDDIINKLTNVGAKIELDEYN